MRYRVSAMVMVMTATAIALAARPWLIGRNDFQVGFVLFVGWTAIGFIFGWGAGRLDFNGAVLWLLAAGGCAANFAFLYFAKIVYELIRDPEVDSPFPEILIGLLSLLESRLTVSGIVTASIAMLVAAALKQKRTIVAILAVSLLFWLTIAWAGFLGSAAAINATWRH